MWYPIKFELNLVEKIWGGHSFLNYKEEVNPNINYGESWEVSAHKNGLSVIANGEFKGQKLIDIINEYGDSFLGEGITEKFDKFPMLIKFLDIHDKLSVQVHPNDEYALENEGEFGKLEAWYVIEASPDAELILGVKEGVTKKELKEKMEDNDFDDLFNIVSVKKGDFINVEPGTVHASLNGSILIYEIQQNSDATYRIYDFDRIFNGQKRELHLKKALDVIDNKKKVIIKNTEKDKREVIELSNNKYFNLEKINCKKKYIEKNDSFFRIYSNIEGKGKIVYNNKEVEFKKGDTFFIPTKLKIEIIGDLELLKGSIKI